MWDPCSAQPAGGRGGERGQHDAVPGHSGAAHQRDPAGMTAHKLQGPQEGGGGCGKFQLERGQGVDWAGVLEQRANEILQVCLQPCCDNRIKVGWDGQGGVVELAGLLRESLE